MEILKISRKLILFALIVVSCKPVEKAEGDVTWQIFGLTELDGFSLKKIKKNVEMACRTILIQ